MVGRSRLERSSCLASWTAEIAPDLVMPVEAASAPESVTAEAAAC